ncbi:murein L,D-transpeptidase family protein [uncultured Roseibium sp.]|uniref:L,D-transpeptidase family protein n=1 Tax=uncultured Roseibium sp. TaxID=1936171 RepID=UPI00260A61C9|nr:murein L,D-transpeptidase family protein [uncultured Roseibium sp.]
MKQPARKHLFLLLSGLFSTAVFSLLMTSVFAQGKLPNSERLENVEAKVLPRLEEEFAEKGLRLGAPVFVRVFKATSELELWVATISGYKRFRTYPICNFSGELGPKLKEGDRQSPEGFYKVTRGLMNPNSRYHLSFNLGFPNAYDRALDRTGSFLMIHGSCVSIGCYAMTDAGIEEIYLAANEAFKGGEEAFDVHVFPFRMTDENKNLHKSSVWSDFWQNLKEGHDAFEKTGMPPSIEVANKRYLIVDTPNFGKAANHLFRQKPQQNGAD